MSRPRKSWQEKLADDKGHPTVFTISGKQSQRWGAGTCVIPAPTEVDELMRRVPKGKVTTIDGRELPANREGAQQESDGDENVIEGEIVPDPEDEPVKSRTTVNQDFEDEVYQLQNDIEALKEVIADDRFPKQRKKIMNAHLNTLQEIKGALEDIIDNVFGE